MKDRNSATMPIAPETAERYREILLDLRQQVFGQVQSLAEAAASATEATALSRRPLNDADNASDAYQQDFSLASLESEQEILRKIEEALRRIREGAYGTCADCGEDISPERLEALPFATRCLRCQADAERDGAGNGRADGEFEILADEDGELRPGEDRS